MLLDSAKSYQVRSQVKYRPAEGRGAAMNVRDEGMRKIAIDNSQVVSVKMSELILKFPPTSLSSRRLVLEIPLNMRKLIGEGEGRYDVFFSRLSFITILNTLNHNSWTVITDVKYIGNTHGPTRYDLAGPLPLRK